MIANLGRAAAVLLLVLGTADKCPSESCAALGTCPQKAPAPNGNNERQGQNQPNPRKADPQPHESGVAVRLSCLWFGPYFITYTAEINGEPQATKERAPKNRDGGTYGEVHHVQPGTPLALTCRAMSARFKAVGRLTCLIQYAEGDALPGPGSYREIRDPSIGVVCTAVVPS